MPFAFGPRSLASLQGVHPDLVKVAQRTLEITPYDFTIIEGARSVEKEQQEVACGKSETMHSRHIPGDDGFAKAIDFMALVDGVGTWDAQFYEEISDAFKHAALELGIPIVWGGDWTTLKDLDHIELDRTKYP